MDSRTVWVCSTCLETHPTKDQADWCCSPTIDDAAPDAQTETGVLRALSHAVDEIGTARELTKNGLLDDHCVNALRELRAAMRMAVGS